jgi:hypothetical protein
MTFRIFNVTNPTEIKNGKKPDVKEVGPYVYREVRRKEDVNEVDGDKINYGSYMEYHFDKDQTEVMGCTGCTKDDPVVVLNVLMQAIANILGLVPLDASVG